MWKSDKEAAFLGNSRATLLNKPAEFYRTGALVACDKLSQANENKKIFDLNQTKSNCC
jgi:hypothetical protein